MAPVGGLVCVWAGSFGVSGGWCLCLARIRLPRGRLRVVCGAVTTALDGGSSSFDWLSWFHMASSHQCHVKLRTADSFTGLTRGRWAQPRLVCPLIRSDPLAFPVSVGSRRVSDTPESTFGRAPPHVGYVTRSNDRDPWAELTRGRPVPRGTIIVSTPRLPIQRRFGWALDGDGWAFGWGWMGVSAHPKKVWTGYRWGFGWAFPADVVVPRSALEFPDKTGPPERERVTLGRLGRFIFRNLVLKPCDHTIGSRTWGLGALAAVSALANSSASGVSTTPNSTLAITFQATVVDDGRLRAGR